MKVTVPVGVDPPDNAAEIELALIAVPAVSVDGAVAERVGLASTLPVKPFPTESTATHSLTDTQATPVRPFALGMWLGVLFGLAAVGSNVTSPPL